MMTTARVRTLLLAIAALGGAVVQAAEKPKAQPAPLPPDVVATVGDARITMAQLEAKAAARLIGLRTQEYDTRRQALDEIIADLVIGKEASVRGISVDDLLRQEVEAKVAPVTDADVKAMYENVKGRLQGKTEADVTPDIQNYLRQQRAQARRAELVRELQAKANVRVLLDPPRITVPPGERLARGGKDATVTIVEFSDFQCPYCSRVTPTLKQVEDRFGDTVRLFFRDFPLPIHPQAPKAAEAALCANDQGKFWEMHDRLFENQSKLQVADLKQHAAELELDAEQFDQCLDSGKHTADWRKDVDEGARYGVSGTPAFFINGRMISGARPYEEFARIIEDELQRAGVPVPPAKVAATTAAKPEGPQGEVK